MISPARSLWTRSPTTCSRQRVENKNTDTAAHDKDIPALTRALWIFDDAVKVALEFQKRSAGETLIITTGDHESGG